MNANDIRRGMIIIYNNAPYRVLDFSIGTPGNLRVRSGEDPKLGDLVRPLKFASAPPRTSNGLRSKITRWSISIPTEICIIS
jgi:hypothetical protein